MKHEWRKKEKALYLPKNKPMFIDVPNFNFITIKGEGNPNSDWFHEYIEALYAVAYAIKMSYKKGIEPEGYFDYTVYPLEGVWDINDEAKKTYDGTLNKDDLIFTLMIRQPDFVDACFTQQMIDFCKQKKNIKRIGEVKFEQIAEGRTVQMLHLGSYDNEPKSFDEMEAFCKAEGFNRLSKIHREIYLTDARRVAPEKYKTVLRFGVE